ncbi:MAG: glycosyltransferase family 2 protein [Polyangiales bacterium]
MSGQPLVSVMMPCFNAERTLAAALVSLRAQTYPHWEAVIVDDGSTDQTEGVIRAWGDPRFRVERFPQNRGRGAARQRALAMARGKYLSFLDADVWLFQGKLAHQVELMEARPEVAVVSGVCIITDAQNQPVGLTRTGLEPGDEVTERAFDRLNAPPLSFPPCMVRMSDTHGADFNPAFRRSQDSDFLIQVLLGKRYAVSREPVYAYSQAEAASLNKTIEGYRYRLRTYAQYTRRYPFQSRLQMGKTLAKMGVYRLAGALGAENVLIERRWNPITPEATAAYTIARSALIEELGQRRK